METVTLSKKKYTTLKQQASLYEKIFKFIPVKLFKTENYTEQRIKEFKQQDQVDKVTRARVSEFLKSLDSGN